MQTTEERFWQKVNKTDSCWLFTGSHNGTGYCVIRANGKSTYVHRYSHELHKGQIPEGLQIDHLCRVRNCVNPEHLESVTFQENMRRKNSKAMEYDCGVHVPGEPRQECEQCRTNYEKIKEKIKRIFPKRAYPSIARIRFKASSVRETCQEDNCERLQEPIRRRKGIVYYRKHCAAHKKKESRLSTP